ncbi:Uncharacterised protein [Streptococcus pneumoniae]|nr:Uncharacterised protein [Streptococcus pneumoniae]
MHPLVEFFNHFWSHKTFKICKNRTFLDKITLHPRYNKLVLTRSTLEMSQSLVDNGVIPCLSLNQFIVFKNTSAISNNQNHSIHQGTQ